jgi:hypothetical protein
MKTVFSVKRGTQGRTTANLMTGSRPCGRPPRPLSSTCGRPLPLAPGHGTLCSAQPLGAAHDDAAHPSRLAHHRPSPSPEAVPGSTRYSLPRTAQPSGPPLDPEKPRTSTSMAGSPRILWPPIRGTARWSRSGGRERQRGREAERQRGSEHSFFLVSLGLVFYGAARGELDPYTPMARARHRWAG